MSAGPVHQPGTFNIEAYSGGRWLGGMNRLTREAAIATARTWAAQDGSRHRVFDLDGKVIFDTDAAPVDVLAEHVMAVNCITVICRANKGKEYRVTFHKRSGGGAVLVESVYRRWNDTGRVFREIWSEASGRPITPLVACAIRSAQAEALARVGGAT